MIGEYSSIVQAGSNAKTVYTTNDHLGSPRINTDGTGQVISRHDYHPFGEEIARTGYGSDTIRKQFTGYERDGETGLDFAQARYYSKKLARFYSVDPENADAEFDVPQSWNAYTYVRNNPLNYTDPTGETIKVCAAGSGTDRCRTYTDEAWREFRKHCQDTGQCFMIDDKATRGRLYFLDPETFTFYFVADFKNESDGTMFGDLMNVMRDRDALNAAAGDWGGYRGLGRLGRVGRSRDGGGSIDDQKKRRGSSAANTSSGQNQKTPRTDPDRFEPVRGQFAKRDKETGEIWVFDRLHRDHYEVYRNRRDYERGRRDRAVWADGRLKEEF